jgi:hypothetical protein
MSALATARSPRLLVKVLCFAFGVIACVIAAVFVLFSWQTDARLRRSVVGNMEASQLRFTGIDARLRREHALQAMALAENPTLKAAVDTYYSERGNAQELGQLQSTIETELTKLQQIMAVPALSVTDVRGIVLASAGPYKRDWPAGVRMSLRVEENGTPPIGIQANTSAKHWDARVAFIDRAPADFFHTENPPFRPNGVVGGGISPRQGTRIGAAAAWGRSGDANVSDPYTLLNVEGEYAFGFTKISGELTRDRFETPTGSREARGATLQVRQTLTPRMFAHSRGTVITSPVTVLATGEVPDRTSWYTDTTLGYLVNAETTVRLAHSAIRKWNAPTVDNQVGVSIVWSKRWW